MNNEKRTQADRIYEVLKNKPLKHFSVKELAFEIVTKFAHDYEEKRSNNRFKTESDFINQISAEIGAHKKLILRKSENIFCQDKPSPRVFWYDPNNSSLNYESEVDQVQDDSNSLSEHELYPKLIQYLQSELGLYSMRIDERKSRKSRGFGANKWLHPDIVAMEALDQEWHSIVRENIKNFSSQHVKLWSFEVKKELTISNTRQSFFQAVSNSSWANEGYLVATSLSSSQNNLVEKELRTLSALHGIGVIILNCESPSESEIFLPSTSKNDVDWRSVDRIVQDNPDFNTYIELVDSYYKTGRIPQEMNVLELE